MISNDETLFEAFLNQYDDEAWSRVIRALLPDIHEVDKTATQIWFYFFPLTLARALQQADDPEQLAQKLVLQGKFFLRDQIDSSHEFLYGHRYWPQVKAVVADYAASTRAPVSLELSAQIREVARLVADKVRADESLLVGITAVAFMTLQQAGAKAFETAPGKINLDPKVVRRSPEQILKARARDDRQGLFGFLKGPEKRYTITFDENDESAKFELINTQHLTTAAMYDKRDYTSRDARCTVNEGPIPVQCRAASCGTCWVGVLGGAEKLSAVGPLEKRRIKEFGYIDTDEANPVIRLACQAQGFGAVSIVIARWSGILGKLLRGQKDSKAEAQKSGV